MQNAINALGNAESDSADGSQVADLLPTREENETGDLFLTECKKRDKATLESLIIDNVADGSRIFTDGWSSYRKV